MPNLTLSACGERLDSPFRYPRVRYQGRDVLFCTVDCLKQYQQDPTRFMAGEIVHTNSNKRTQPPLEEKPHA